MLMNAFERALIRAPGRGFLMRHFEGKRLLRMGGPMNGGRALEIGCGVGAGVEVILDMFGADTADAFDLDASTIEIAKRRTQRLGNRARVWVGDAGAIEAADNSYEAVFDFAIIHHIHDWQAALREVHRVLKPGGRFYAQEVLEKFITHPLWRRVFLHPQENRFDHDKFVAGLEEAGMRLVVSTSSMRNQIGWFIADKPSSR